jgi:hypothetical protein
VCGKRALSGDCGCDGTEGAAEGNEEGVALRIDFSAAMLADRGPEESTVLRKHRPIPLLQPLEQLGGPADVGKEKRHRPGRQFAHAGSIAAAVSAA